MKQSKFLLGLSLFALISGALVGCGGEPSTTDPSKDPTSGDISDKPTNKPTEVPSSKPTEKPTSKPTETPTEGGDITIDPDSDYDSKILEWSQKDHLYIHYTRGSKTTIKDYEKYAVWLWNLSPKKSEGGLFGHVEDVPSLSGNWKNNKIPFMSDIGGSGKSVDEAGVCLDIDLTKDYIDGYGEPLNFSKSLKLGFLIVDTTTMAGGTHWTSDGNADTFFTLEKALQDNGSYHIYLATGSVQTPRFKYNDKIKENPVVKDTTGKYDSKGDIKNSSASSFKTSPTSKKFHESQGVGYQIMVPTFADSNADGIGDLRGVINKLPYLKSLNVNSLWLTPFLECNSYHGYDTVDYFKIDPRFGTMQDFNELIYKAHEMDMTVLMDLVINHASTAGELFKKAQRAEKGIDAFGNEFEYRNMFHFLMEGSIAPSGKKVEDDPKNWVKDGESKYYYYAKFGDSMPDFNYDYQATRDYVKNVGLYWLGKGVDGFRLDAIKHIYMADEVEKKGSDKILEDISDRTYWDEQKGEMITEVKDYSTNETKNIAFWKEFSNELKAIYPDCYLVGENFDGWDKRVAPLYQSMDSQFDFNNYYHNLEYVYLHLADGPYVNGTNAGKLALATETKLNTYFKQYRSDAINSTFTSNHDVIRAINLINSTKAGTEVVPATIKGTAEEINRAKIHAAISILQPGLSFIYYGDELGMSSNVSENKYKHENHLDRFYRQPMKWKEESERPFITIANGFTNEYDSYNKTLADVDAQASDKDSMLSFYKAITAVKNLPDFPVNGNYKGYEIKGSPSMLHYTISGNGVTYKFFIHTAGHNDDKNKAFKYDAGTDELVLNINATKDTINPYGVVVLKSK